MGHVGEGERGDEARGWGMLGREREMRQGWGMLGRGGGR